MESMIKCKVFTPIDAYELEKQINNFAEEAANHDSKIVDIKYQTDSALEYSALVLYEVKGV